MKEKIAIDYCVIAGAVENDNTDSFNYKVKLAMQKGWQPIGGICFAAVMDGSTQLSQAMVKYGYAPQP